MSSQSMACRYPAHLVDVVRLAERQRVTIRPIRPQDVRLLNVFFQGLAPQSRYARFMTHWRDVPQPMLEAFADIDYHRHFALVACILDESGREVVIGEGRFVVSNDNTQQCEFALAVADAWHRKGLGSLLLAKIETQASLGGIRVITGETLPSNEAMQRVARRAGYAVSVASGHVNFKKYVSFSEGNPKVDPCNGSTR